MKKIISLLILCLLLTACTEKFKTIATNEAIELIDKGAMVIDVRTADEYNTGHIKGAINLPLDIINTITYDKEENLIIYCASGKRSLEAVNTLVNMGYTHLYNLDGGMLNWGGDTEE